VRDFRPARDDGFTGHEVIVSPPEHEPWQFERFVATVLGISTTFLPERWNPVHRPQSTVPCVVLLRHDNGKVVVLALVNWEGDPACDVQLAEAALAEITAQPLDPPPTDE